VNDARLLLDRFFGPAVDSPAERSYLWPRWLFLRALGIIFFSAFYSLAFQIQGLIGPRGILPAGPYLADVARVLPGLSRFWRVPTLLWLGAGSGSLTALVWGGLIASVLLIVNLWPRLATAVCLVLFLSFLGAAQDFASYQSDGMLLEAAFLSLFFAPAGLRPGLGAQRPPSRASLFLLRWEWFRIYFESGIVKLLSGDLQWRQLTAMDHYYENGPLPSWPGWYTQQLLPHGFHAATAAATLALELAVVWLAWLPRRFRLACFLIVTRSRSASSSPPTTPSSTTSCWCSASCCSTTPPWRASASRRRPPRSPPGLGRAAPGRRSPPAPPPSRSPSSSAPPSSPTPSPAARSPRRPAGWPRSASRAPTGCSP
jgi:hypothetical protein